MTKNKNSGYSLIELSLVIAILSIIMVSLLNLLTPISELKKRSTTIERMNFIMETIDKFVDTHGYLPCPADPARNPKDQYFLKDQTPATGTCTSVDSDFIEGTDNVVVGLVPAFELEINPIYATDGWGSGFTLVVDEDYTVAAGYSSLTDSGIEILNQVSVNVVEEGSDVPVVLLISHGSNKHGAFVVGAGAKTARYEYPKSANATQISSRSMEDDNIHFDTAINTTFYTAPLRDVEGADPTGTIADQIFDDILMYRTKWQLDN